MCRTDSTFVRFDQGPLTKASQHIRNPVWTNDQAMRAKFISNPLDPLSDLGTGGSDANFFPAPFYPSTNYADTNAFAHLPPSTPGPLLTPALPAESVEAQAAVAQNGSGGLGSVVAVAASSGFTINLIFDATAMAAPASFRSGIEQAASILSATISNKITVNINIDYSGTGGGAAAGPDNGLFESYSTVRTDLINNAALGDTTFNALPSGSTIQGQSQVAVWNAQLKLFGLLSSNNTTTDDGSATFATDISPSLLVGVALHELTHAMGRVPYGPQPDIFDFYRFTSVGTRLFSDNIPASAAYFSINGGTTKLADFGVSSDPSDFLNPPNSNLTPNDAFNEFYSGSTLQSLTTVDKEMLDALGFNTSPQGIVVATTAVEAIQGGAAVTLLSGPPSINDPSSATLSSATIKIANASNSVVAGDKLFVNGVQSGSVGNGVTASWNASTGTLTLTGGASIAVYDTLLSEVSYQDTGTDASSGSHPVRTVTWTVSDGTNSFSTTSQVSVDRATGCQCQHRGRQSRLDRRDDGRFGRAFERFRSRWRQVDRDGCQRCRERRGFGGLIACGRLRPSDAQRGRLVFLCCGQFVGDQWRPDRQPPSGCLRLYR